jgi:hypothetical protein
MIEGEQHDLPGSLAVERPGREIIGEDLRMAVTIVGRRRQLLGGPSIAQGDVVNLQ